MLHAEVRAEFQYERQKPLIYVDPAALEREARYYQWLAWIDALDVPNGAGSFDTRLTLNLYRHGTSGVLTDLGDVVRAILNGELMK